MGRLRRPAPDAFAVGRSVPRAQRPDTRERCVGSGSGAPKGFRRDAGKRAIKPCKIA